jgi:hypothetical protein
MSSKSRLSWLSVLKLQAGSFAHLERCPGSILGQEKSDRMSLWGENPTLFASPKWFSYGDVRSLKTLTGNVRLAAEMLLQTGLWIGSTDAITGSTPAEQYPKSVLPLFKHKVAIMQSCTPLWVRKSSACHPCLISLTARNPLDKPEGCSLVGQPASQTTELSGVNWLVVAKSVSKGLNGQLPGGSWGTPSQESTLAKKPM